MRRIKNHLLGLCLLMIAAGINVQAETLPASNVTSSTQIKAVPRVATDQPDEAKLFRQVQTKQECLVFMAKYEPAVDPELWCKQFDGNLVFQLSNQSPNVDPVDFLISIDGKRIIDKEMPYAHAHFQEMIPVRVPSGTHVVVVESNKGHTRMRRTITVKDRLYLGISFWYYTRKDPNGPVMSHFTIETSSHAFTMQ